MADLVKEALIESLKGQIAEEQAFIEREGRTVIACRHVVADQLTNLSDARERLRFLEAQLSELEQA